MVNPYENPENAPVTEDVKTEDDAVDVDEDAVEEVSDEVSESESTETVEEVEKDAEEVEASEDSDKEPASPTVESSVENTPSTEPVAVNNGSEEVTNEEDVESEEDDNDLPRKGYAVVFIQYSGRITKDMVKRKRLDSVKKDGDILRFNDAHNICFSGPFESNEMAIKKRKRYLSYGIVGYVRYIDLDFAPNVFADMDEYQKCVAANKEDKGNADSNKSE